RGLAHVAAHQVAHLLRVAAEAAGRAQAAVVAQADDVRAQVGLRVADRLPADRRVAHRRRLRALQVHRHRQARDPDIGAALEPFVVADAGEALAAPRIAPGVLQPEAVAVVGDDGEGVVTHRGLLLPGDRAAGGRVDPAVMHGARRIQHADLGEGGVHGHQVLVVDAEIGAQRVAQRRAGARLGVAVAFAVGVAGVDRRAGPGRLRTHAVPVPALHRTAAAGARIAFALPFVVAARHVVEHARADARGVGAGAARAQQGVGDGGQAERGAGAFVALVEDGHVEGEIALQRHVGGHVDQGRLEHAVAEVRGVGARVEQARTVFAGACRRAARARLLRRGHGFPPTG